MKRSSVRVTIEVRQPDGSLVTTELVLHPPTFAIHEAIAEAGIYERLTRAKTDAESVGVFLEMAAVLLSRFDRERGQVDWLKRNLEGDDISKVVEGVIDLFGLKDRAEKKSPGEAGSP